MRLIEAIVPDKRADEVQSAIEDAKPEDWRVVKDVDGKCVFRAFFMGDTAQPLVDALQEICEGADDWRLLVYPVEATAPQPEEEPDKDENDEENSRKREMALREEIYADVAEGAALSPDFYALTLASTIVAALGMNADNVAAVIGAMVIAPLLGPILAFSLAAALGDFKLLMRAARNAGLGLAVGIAGAVVIGLLIELNFEADELMSRTVAGLDSIVLGLSAGVAAALSVVAGVSAALVGVMVAVALLPPAAAAGLFLGAGEPILFLRAGLMLTVNVVCIMLAAQTVYVVKGVRPRTWLERKKAKSATRINVAVLAFMLAGLGAIIFFLPEDVKPEFSESSSSASGSSEGEAGNTQP